MENKKTVQQLDLFDKDGNPILPVETAQEVTQKVNSPKPTVLMTVEEKQAQDEDDEKDYEYEWQRIHNR